MGITEAAQFHYLLSAELTYRMRFAYEQYQVLLTVYSSKLKYF